MKRYINQCLFSAFLLTTVANASAVDPRTNSWLTTYSAKYARLYTTDANKTSGTSVTTWSNGTQIQSTPAYCGVQEMYSSANWVYIRTSGLGSHTMGPWYLNAARTQVFPNYPKNQKVFYRLPRNPTIPGTKTLTGNGAIGYFVDGVAMFDSRDAFYWNGTADVNGSGNWNRDAYVNEGLTFDPASAHQPGNGQYHYHANPPALRFLFGDNIAFNSGTKTYSEISTTNLHHSPILGWVRDGFPIYGPYGYANATNANSGIRRMISGYVLRNGQNGTLDLATTGRTTLPAWAGRSYNRSTTLSSGEYGPGVSTSFPLGRYMEDNEYLGDLGKTQGVDFDLDEYNVRFCVTPEFPNGTNAYFVCISSNGTPVFPYNIGRSFYGNPNGNTVASLAEGVSTNFVGGSESVLKSSAPTVNTNNTISLVWSSTEGGSYQVDSTVTLTNWTTRGNVLAVGSTTQTNLARTNNVEFYRLSRTSLATYDPVK